MSITLLQHKSLKITKATGANPWTLTFDTPVTPGSAIVVLLQSAFFSHLVSSVTDGGDSFNQVFGGASTSATADGTGDHKNYGYLANNSGGGAKTISVAWSGTVEGGSIAIFEYDTGGQALSADGSGAFWGQQSNGTNPLTLQAGPIATPYGDLNEVLLFFGGSQTDGGTFASLSAGFTLEESYTDVSDGQSGFFADQVVSSQNVFFPSISVTAHVAGASYDGSIFALRLPTPTDTFRALQSNISSQSRSSVNVLDTKFKSAVQVGSKVLVAIISVNSPTSVTDDAGNPSYTAVRGPDNNGTDGNFTALYLGTVATGGLITVHVNYGSTTTQTAVIAIVEYPTFTAVDKTAFTTGTSTAPDSGATASTTFAHELLLGFGGSISTNSSWTPGSGYTAQKVGEWSDSTTPGQAGFLSLIFEDKVVNALGTYHGLATAIPESTPYNWSMSIATFYGIPQTANQAHSVDADISPTLSSPTHSIDAEVFIPFSTTHNIDAYPDVQVPFTAPTYVSSGQASGAVGPDSPISVTLTGVQVGDVIVVWSSWFGETVSGVLTPSSISDNGSNVYESVISQVLVTNVLGGSPGTKSHLGQQGCMAVVTNANGGTLVISASWAGYLQNNLLVELIRGVDPGAPLQGVSTNQDLGYNVSINSGSKSTSQSNTFASGCASIQPYSLTAPVAGGGWASRQSHISNSAGFTLASTLEDQVVSAKGTPTDATFTQTVQTPTSGAIAQLILLNPIMGDSHSIDTYIQHLGSGFLQEEIQLIPPITDPDAFLLLNSDLAQPSLDFLRLAALVQDIQQSFLNLDTILAWKNISSYLKLSTTLGKGGSPSHSIDAVISLKPISFLNLAVNLAQPLVPAHCNGSFPDISFLKCQVWLVQSGKSQQAPGTAMVLADDWLSQQDALAAYQTVARFVLAGIPLVVTGFTSGVTSWQTRTRQWLRLVDYEAGGVVISSTTSTRRLPNGQTIVTNTKTTLVQDTTVVEVTTTDSVNPNRVIKSITEKTQGGNTTTHEVETNLINGVRVTTERKNVTAKTAPNTENIQPIKVTTLDGVMHYQFFGAPNDPQWAGGDPEGLTVTDTAVTTGPNTRTTNQTISTPDGKVINIVTDETGLQDVGVILTDTNQQFEGIQSTTKKTVTFPDGSQQVTTTVTNSTTGDSTATTVSTATDENGLTTTTTTVEETKTFQDPTTGAYRTTIQTTTMIDGPTGTIVDTTNTVRDNFEDDLISAKIKVYLIQEFTLNVIIDRFSKDALEEVATDHQKNFAITELIGQQLGNMDLSWALRQNLIGQFYEALACIEPVELQALGKTYDVVFAPSASCFRAKYIPGTMPAVFELQMIIQQRSDLVTGLKGF